MLAPQGDAEAHHALMFHSSAFDDDERADVAADTNQLLYNSINIWNDLEPSGRRDCEKQLDEQLKRLTAMRVVGTAGVDNRRPVSPSGGNRSTFGPFASRSATWAVRPRWSCDRARAPSAWVESRMPTA